MGKLILAFFIATPLIYVAGTGFLSVFPRHIDLKPGIFLLGGLMAMVILLISTGIKLFQASNANPVETLKYE